MHRDEEQAVILHGVSKKLKQLVLIPVKTATHFLRSRAKHFKNALADTIKMQISKKKIISQSCTSDFWALYLFPMYQ